MMKRTTKIVSAIVLTLGIATAGATYAGKFGKSHGEDHEEHASYAVMFVAKKFDLDATQEQALVALKDEVFRARSVMEEQMQTVRGDVLALFEADSFDQAKALEIINTKTSTVDSVAPEIVGALGNFIDTLDSEQKQEMLDFLESRHGKRRGGHWRH